MQRVTAQTGDTDPLMALPDDLDSTRLPRHLAVIMDGNGRWAQQRRLPRVRGHQMGVQALKRLLQLCGHWGIPALTTYAFSTENWQRPDEEVSFLMALFEQVLKQELNELDQARVRLRFLGDLEALPPGLQEHIARATARTAHHNRVRLNVCTNYGGRHELVQVARRLAQDVRQGILEPDDINEARFANLLLTAGDPDPDLLIRTSGEFRISNFLLWQLAYAEIHITDVLWPDFDQAALATALRDFQRRQRRYGTVQPSPVGR
ncbi:isoprenyl transferase [Candidatus Synechococcus spongiarum]|uniref:Isoprenyl transferase n=1 Tax=Candidatus Synechococcus spongiarum LMB bulk15N TaxID=1943583 RepID=A0A1T1D3A8_9SYNE|nr:isoprenyl transferase [Candidatus Synechococcus spongiarum]OOV35345.1 isoprenyl transferase [Candidatus Synechococcus spongiarum LMB bulk15N]